VVAGEDRIAGPARGGRSGRSLAHVRNRGAVD
jgi:hypothetical protein